jgi:hypothetical protein
MLQWHSRNALLGAAGGFEAMRRHHLDKGAHHHPEGKQGALRNKERRREPAAAGLAAFHLAVTFRPTATFA